MLNNDMINQLAGSKPSRYECFSSISETGSFLLYSSSNLDPTAQRESKSYNVLAFVENICKAILPEKKYGLYIFLK